jgi:membrane carboxypeptidase/penicillin-binding protein
LVILLNQSISSFFSSNLRTYGKTVFKYPDAPLPFVAAADRTSFYQLKTMLQGVVARGTARAIGAHSPYVAGKTGTTEDAVDGWFIGFTNDVTIAVWVGYDNGNGKRRSLGTNATGARVALPIFEPILQSVWAEGTAPKALLNGPSPEAKRDRLLQRNQNQRWRPSVLRAFPRRCRWQGQRDAIPARFTRGA